MMVGVAGPVRVSEGQVVTFTASLKGDDHSAYCGIYSRIGKYDPSPHMDFLASLSLQGGMPRIVTPTAIRLHPSKRTGSITITADEECDFFIYQDVDTAKSPRVKARINPNERFKYAVKRAIRRLLGK
jgi:hypothetical protein